MSSGRFAGWTLRRRLVTALVALAAIITLLIGLVTGLALQRSLEQGLDERVVDTASRALRPDHGPRDQGPDSGLGGDFLLLVTDGQNAVTNVVFDTAGQPTSLNTQQIDALVASDLSAQPATVDLGGSLGRWRLVSTQGRGATVISGLPTADLERTVAEVRTATLLLSLLGIVLIGGATWLIVRRTLRPLDRVAALATHVSTLPLSSGQGMVAERIPPQDTDRRTEVGKVGASVNDLLDHVETSLRARQAGEEKLRRFVADASHELRTPLASIRGYAELTRREREPVPGNVRHALDRVQSEAERMTSLVEDLLFLARLDAGRASQRTEVDLTRIVLDATGDAHVAGPEHVWQLDLPEDAVEAVGDPGELTQVVVNLLANARTHTPPGTIVLTSLREEGDEVVLTVADDGPGFAPGLADTLFERFTRGEESRTGGSTGLGLSIVAAVVTAHHGTVRATNRDDGGAQFEVRLPRT